MSGQPTETAACGVNITTGATASKLLKVNISLNSTATKVYLQDVAGNLLASTFVVGKTATLNYDLTAYTEYRILADAEGADYVINQCTGAGCAAFLPVVDSYINWTSGYYSGTVYPTVYNIANITLQIGAGLAINLVNPTPNDGTFINTTLSVNASISGGVSECNLSVNGTNYTMTVSADYSYCSINQTLADGNYSYFIRAFNSSSGSSYVDTVTRTVVVDTSSPGNLNLLPPSYSYFNVSTTFNLTHNESNVKYCNITINNTQYSMVNIGGGTCQYNFTNQVGNYSVNISITDMVNFTSYLYNYFYYGFNVTNVFMNFSKEQIDLKDDNMILNLTMFNFNSSYSVWLLYNNSNYTTDANLTGNNLYANTSVIPPAVLSGGSIPVNFTWYVQLNHSMTLSFYNNTTVSSTNLTNCNIKNGTLLYRFDFYDQDFPTVSVNSTMDATFYLYGGSGTIKNFSFNFSTPTPTILICINQSTGTGTFSVDSVQQYRATNYQDIYYYLLNSSVDVGTQYNISLFNLNSSSSIATKYTVLSGASTSPVVGAYIQIQRFYPATNQLLLVSMAKTDVNGIGNSYAIPNNINYRYVVIEDYSIKYSSSMATLPCDPASTLCQITIYISSATINPYSAFIGATGVFCKYNSTMALVYCVSDDPSGTGSRLRLRLYQLGNYDKTLVCDNSVYSGSGAVICAVPDIAKTYSWVGTATIGSDIIIDSGTINTLITSTFQAENGLIFTMIFVVSFGLLGLAGGFSSSIIASFAGLILSILIGLISIDLVFLGPLAVIVAALAWVLRG
jgi:hypothetical protein